MKSVAFPAAGSGRRGQRGRPGRRRRAARRTVAALVATGLLAGACATETPSPPVSAAGTGSGSLSGVCPDPIVIQTGWWPEAEHGAIYGLLGDEYTVDTENLRVTGPLMAGDEDTGVAVEIRAGGPAIGFQLPSAALYADDAITLAVVATDEAVSVSATTPVLSVAATLDIFPVMIMWDPETYPQFNTVVDIGASDTTVLYFQDAPYMEYLIQSGILKREQVDGSYDGSPSRWVAENGAIAQQGFATNEPYVYQNELIAWQRPVRMQLIHHLGYQVYDTLAIRAGQKEELAACLQSLVPMVQQSLADYVQDPAATNDLIVELAEAYGGFAYSPENARFAVDQMLELEIVSNAENDTLGDFDTDRVAEVIGIVSPIYTAQRREVRADLTVADIATNEYIDPAIGLP
jgi:hypothetical protein